MIITAGRPGEDRAQVPIQDRQLRYAPEQSGVAVNEVRWDGILLLSGGQAPGRSSSLSDEFRVIAYLRS